MSLPNLLPAAQQELAAAIDCYEARRPGLEVEFLGAVDLALHAIADAPEHSPAWQQNRRYRRLALELAQRGALIVLALSYGVDDEGDLEQRRGNPLVEGLTLGIRGVESTVSRQRSLDCPRSLARRQHLGEAFRRVPRADTDELAVRG